MRVATVALPVIGVYERPDEDSPLVTQALHGSSVVLMEEGEWCWGLVGDGSCGWFRRSWLCKPDLPRGRAVVVATPQARVLCSGIPTGFGLFMGTELFVLEDDSDWYWVATRSGLKGWISKEAVSPVPGLRPAGGISASAAAQLFLGVPYLWGGVTFKGIDCSGLSHLCYLVGGCRIARDARDQYLAGQPVGIAELEPGDLVFFSTTAPGASHVGIYTENGEFINARSREGVCVSALEEPYFKDRYLGARRYFFLEFRSQKTEFRIEKTEDRIQKSESRNVEYRIIEGRR